MKDQLLNSSVSFYLLCPPEMNMEQPIHKKRKIFRLLAYLAGGLLLFFVAVVSLAAIYEKEVSRYFLSKLNERLQTRVEIKEVELSLLKHFPYATVSLNQVRAGHTHIKAEGYLLDVERIDLMFNIFSLWSGNYAIRKIEIVGGKIQLIRDKSGKTNYDLFKPAPGAKDDPFGLSIDQIAGRKLDIIYRDEPEDFYIRAYVELSDLAGQFNAQSYQLDIAAELQVDRIGTGKNTWLSQKPLGIDVSMQVDKANSSYSFSNGAFRIADLEVDVEGKYSNAGSAVYNFQLRGKNLDIRSALSLLPSEYADKIKAYSSKGKFFGEFNVRKEKGEASKPSISGQFGVENGTVSHKPSGVELTALNFRADLRGETLKIENAVMHLNGQKISGSCVLKGLTNPEIDLQTDASINLPDLAAFLDIKALDELKGHADLHLKLRTRINDLASEKLSARRYLASGSLHLSDAAFRISGDTMRFQSLKGDCTFNSTDMTVSSLTFSTGRSDFNVAGRMENLTGWLLNDHEMMNLSISLKSQKVLLDELFQRKAVNAAENEYRFAISPRISVDLAARIDQLQFRKFSASNIIGEFGVKNQQFSARQIRFNTMGGQVTMTGNIEAATAEKIRFSCNAQLKSVDIQRLFFECENFGQQTMQDKNLKGKVDASLVFSATGNPSLEIDPASAECTADITINNGELIRFEPLNELGRYISLEELQHVRFSQLRNQIRISKKTIYFPLMDIASSAISISGSGTHTFDNMIDYHIRVRLSDIMANKAKRQKRENESFGEVADDGSGGLNLFLSMKGPMDNPKVSYDSKGAREKRKDDIRKEKENLRNIFREEFGRTRKDSVKKPDKDQKKKKPAITIEFDE